MFNIRAALVTSAIAIIAATVPAVAHDSQTLRSALGSGRSHDTVAIGSTQTDAKIVYAVPADMPPFEQLARIGGVAQIVIDLDDSGKLLSAIVQRSTGRARLDESALRAVRASAYRPETIDGQGMSGRYVVEVVLDPTLALGR